MIKVKNLTCKEESGNPLISGASFEIKNTDRIAVLSNNQERSTILCHALAGILYRSYPAHTIEGSVYYEDQPIDTLDSHERANSIAYVPPDSDLLISGVKDAVFGEIALSLELTGTAPDVIREKVSHILRRIGIEKLMDRDPDELSGGERHKVALASMIVREPNVLILDNPTMHLDITGVNNLLTILRSYHGTIIIADPNPYIWSSVVKRFIVIVDTEVLIYDTSMELLRIIDKGENECELPSWTELYLKLRNQLNLKNELNSIHSLTALRTITGVIR
jgi:energy-coupling factor transport system ATP-binding protein